MKCIAKAFALALVLALFVPNISLAEESLVHIAKVLDHEHVYIDPSIENAEETKDQLKTLLRSNDHIVLIMLPSTAEVRYGMDPLEIAKSLSDSLGNRRIIGLAVGNTTVGYAPTTVLQSGIAADRMVRADNITSDPAETLIQFAQTVHIWQSANPMPTPSPSPTPVPVSTKTHEPSDQSSLPFWLIVAVCSAIIIVGVIYYLAKWRFERVQKLPLDIAVLMANIARMREEVNDQELANSLVQLELDIREYFKSSIDRSGDSLFLKDRLTEVDGVLSTYLKVKENSRYYNNPNVLLSQGKESLIDFGDYLIETIRSGNDENLRAFRFNANVLQAHRSLTEGE